MWKRANLVLLHEKDLQADVVAGSHNDKKGRVYVLEKNGIYVSDEIKEAVGFEGNLKVRSIERYEDELVVTLVEAGVPSKNLSSHLEGRTIHISAPTYSPEDLERLLTDCFTEEELRGEDDTIEGVVTKGQVKELVKKEIDRWLRDPPYLFDAFTEAIEYRMRALQTEAEKKLDTAGSRHLFAMEKFASEFGASLNEWATCKSTQQGILAVVKRTK